MYKSYDRGVYMVRQMLFMKETGFEVAKLHAMEGT